MSDWRSLPQIELLYIPQLILDNPSISHKGIIMSKNNCSLIDCNPVRRLLCTIQTICNDLLHNLTCTYHITVEHATDPQSSKSAPTCRGLPQFLWHFNHCPGIYKQYVSISTRVSYRVGAIYECTCIYTIKLQTTNQMHPIWILI